jgi:hypothetical protein
MSLLLLSVVLPLDVACFSVAHCRRTEADCPRGCMEAAILVVYLHARGVSASGRLARLQGNTYSYHLSSCWVFGSKGTARSRLKMGLSADSNHAAMLFGIWCEHGGFVGGERVNTFTSCVVHTCGKHWTACIVCALDFELRVCSVLLSSSVNIESCRISGTLRLSTASTIKFQFTHFTSTSNVSLRCP